MTVLQTWRPPDKLWDKNELSDVSNNTSAIYRLRIIALNSTDLLPYKQIITLNKFRIM